MAGRDAYLLRTYGITEAQYEAILAAQGGVCAVCGQPPKGRRLAVDHHHGTGEVRGLLCAFDNNKVVGRHKDSRRLHAAAAYMDDPPARRVLPAGHVVPAKRKPS